MGLDKTIFGDGVLVDINTHRITVALKSDVPIPVRAIYDRIKKGGYDPVMMHLRLRGRVNKIGDILHLKVTDSGQTFFLTGEKVNDLVEAEDVDIQVRLDARKIPKLDDKEVITVVVEKILPPEKRND